SLHTHPEITVACPGRRSEISALEDGHREELLRLISANLLRPTRPTGDGLPRGDEMKQLLRLCALTLAGYAAARAGLIQIGFTSTPLSFEEKAQWNFATPVTLALPNSSDWNANLIEGAFAG